MSSSSPRRFAVAGLPRTALALGQPPFPDPPQDQTECGDSCEDAREDKPFPLLLRVGGDPDEQEHGGGRSQRPTQDVEKPEGLLYDTKFTLLPVNR